MLGHSSGGLSVRTVKSTLCTCSAISKLPWGMSVKLFCFVQLDMIARATSLIYTDAPPNFGGTHKQFCSLKFPGVCSAAVC